MRAPNGPWSSLLTSFIADKVIVLSEDGAVRTGQDTAREDGPLAVSADRFVNDVNNLITVSAIERLPRASRHGLPAADADPGEEPEWSGIVLAEMQREFAFLFMRPHSYLHPRKFDYMVRTCTDEAGFSWTRVQKVWFAGCIKRSRVATAKFRQVISTSGNPRRGQRARFKITSLLCWLRWQLCKNARYTDCLKIREFPFKLVLVVGRAERVRHFFFQTRS